MRTNLRKMARRLCYVNAKRSLRLLELVVGLEVSSAAFLPLRMVLIESEVLYPRASVLTDVARLRSNRRFDDLALAMRFCVFRRPHRSSVL